MTDPLPDTGGSHRDAPPPHTGPRPIPRAASVFGWYGTFAILGAYAGISLGWLERGPVYQLLNLTGAAGVGLVCWYRRTWQAFWLEVAWVAIALVALASALVGTAD